MSCRTLIHSVAEVISTEARAMYNVGQAGLTYFAPFMNIFRYKACKKLTIICAYHNNYVYI